MNIENNNSISISLTGEVIEAPSKHPEFLDRVIAEKKAKDKDLMYLKFRYVHEGENANKDAFEADELRERHSTAVYKPVNLQHKETKIVGVIYDTEFIEREDSDNGKAGVNIYAVMYKWLFPAVAEEISEKYNKNDLSVSMETWFDKAKCSICNESFAEEKDYCEHLKNRFAVAENSRILKGITFGGVGIVDRPADTDAVALALASDTNASLKTQVEKRLELQKFDAIMYETQNVLYNIMYGYSEDSEDTRSKKQKLSDLLTELKDLIDTINVNKIAKGEITEMEVNVNTLAEALLIKAKAENKDAFETQLSEEINNIKADYEDRIVKLSEQLTTVTAERDTVVNDFNTFKDGIQRDKLLASRKTVLAEKGIEFPITEDSDTILLEMTDKVFDLLVQTKAAKKEEEVPNTNATASLQINDADANTATASTEKTFDLLAALSNL